MFDKSVLPSERTAGEQNLNQLRDGLSSLTYRIGEIESLLSKKVQHVVKRWIDQNAYRLLKKR